LEHLEKLNAKFTKMKEGVYPKANAPSPTLNGVHSIMLRVVTVEDMERERGFFDAIASMDRAGAINSSSCANWLC
jgi:N-methylhydantoinase B/oxoprolinase/acetone carboxylase alpha subunit